MTPVAVKSTAPAPCCSRLCRHRPEQWRDTRETERDWQVDHVDSLLAAYRCLSSFHQKARQRQQSYIIMVTELDGIL